MSTAANFKKAITVQDVYLKVDRANGDTEYHKLVESNVTVVDGVPTLSGGKDIIISEEEYKENA